MENTVCRTCHIIKPVRSYHCSICDVCVENHDHHCPWVGTCVGKRNYKYFVSFISATAIFALLTFLIDVLVIARGYWLYTHYFHFNLPAILMIFISVGTFFTMMPFSAYHIYLISKGMGTNESIRGKYKKFEKNPFNLGCKRNWNRVFC